ncbi:MAG: hypothetical protein GX800_02450 [Clostridiaceae bacterium]|nr:hypothetical protein [Clostridiaceae bacterium]
MPVCRKAISLTSQNAKRMYATKGYAMILSIRFINLLNRTIIMINVINENMKTVTTINSNFVDFQRVSLPFSTRIHIDAASKINRIMPDKMATVAHSP